MRLRSSLLLLAAVTAAPLLVVAIAGAVYVLHSENSAFVNAALTRNRATLQAVDAELLGTVGALRTLAVASWERWPHDRTRAEAPAGTLASAGFRHAVSKSQEGWYGGATIEGRDG